MSEELENKSQETTSQDQKQDGREGYSRPSGYQNTRDYHPQTGRTQRPRIHTNTSRSYNSERVSKPSETGGFRPEGFGAGLSSSDQQRPQRSSYQQGGYQRQSSYQQRPRYNNSNSEGGYQPRQQGGYQRQGGYQQRPRYNNSNPEGGYQQRQQGGYQRQGGYQPRQQSGYGHSQQGGYQRQGGYQQRQGSNGNSYKSFGGYNKSFGGGYNNNRKPYGNRPGYDPNAKYSMKKRIEYKEEHTDPNEPIRLNKYLANAGVCSRREADDYIQSGAVTVNGTVVTELGTKVKRSDEVKFRDQPVTIEKKVYILLNKPKDYVTTSDDPQQRKTVMDLVKDACPERIYPVGRLDRNTTGVLLLTNDGELASKLTHPKFLKKKVYHVFLDKNVSAEDLQKIADGIELEDGEVHADAIEFADERDHSQVGIEIHSGKNRIVRRIFEHLGYRVVKLDRVQFAGLTKKNLRRGDWRFLTEKEVEILRSGMFE